jgi:YfiH family protein
LIDLGALLGVPGVRAAASERADGPLGFTGAPDPAAVREARRRFLGALGLDAAAAVAARQVHGARVLVVGPADRGRGALDPATGPGDADGLVTAEAGIPLLALGADCAVAVLAAPGGRAVGVVHAGWRGAVARAPGAAVAALRDRLDAAPAELRAALGPAAGPCCYEVGEEVREAFAREFGAASAPWFRPGPRGRPRLDLGAAVRAGLAAAGMEPGRVAPPGPCTICDSRWFSHRRGDAGRQGVVVARLPATDRAGP